MRVEELKVEEKGEILVVLTARGKVIRRISVGLSLMCNANHAGNLVMWKGYVRTRMISRSSHKTNSVMGRVNCDIF